MHQRPPRRVSPSKRARTSSPGEFSSSRLEPSQSPAAQSLTRSSPQVSPASRIRRPLFHYDLIPGNVNCRAKDFHEESYYDISSIGSGPTVMRFYAVGPQVFHAVVYDTEANFLSPGGS